jgi:hypothetical protein
MIDVVECPGATYRRPDACRQRRSPVHDGRRGAAGLLQRRRSPAGVGREPGAGVAGVSPGMISVSARGTVRTAATGSPPPITAHPSRRPLPPQRVTRAQSPPGVGAPQAQAQPNARRARLLAHVACRWGSSQRAGALRGPRTACEVVVEAQIGCIGRGSRGGGRSNPAGPLATHTTCAMTGRDLLRSAGTDPPGTGNRGERCSAHRNADHARRPQKTHDQSP